MRRSRITAGLVTLVYAGAVLAVPVLHRLHHEAHGADHVHTAAGTLYFGSTDADVDSNSDGDVDVAGNDEAAHHAAFDADLEALDLSDAAHAGVPAVDCALADYTLASCAGALPGHPHTFGDELLARDHLHHHPAPFDPTHGEGSPEHLGASLLAARTFILPPPTGPVWWLALAPCPRRHAHAPLLTHACRGPPPVA